MILHSHMTSTFDFIDRELSGEAAAAASTRKYPVPTISTHTKDKEIVNAPAVSTAWTFQIAQDWQPSTDLALLQMGKYF